MPTADVPRPFPDETPAHEAHDDESMLHQLRHEVEPEEAALADIAAPLGRWALLSRRIILIGAIPAFAGFYLWQALTIALPNRPLLVSPRGFPTLVAVLMAIVAIAIAIIEIRKILRERRGAELREGADDDDTERITSWRDAWVALGALVVYIAVFSFLGFFLATTLFLVGTSTYFAPRKWLRNVIASVLFSIAVYLLFTQLLQVRLPAGLLAGVM